MHHYFPVFAVAYVLGAGAGVIADAATAPIWALFMIPVIPVVVGYLLTRGKLKKQDARVQEIHILVNSRLSKTLDALSAALVENVELKTRLGIPVTTQERKAAENPVVLDTESP